MITTLIIDMFEKLYKEKDIKLCKVVFHKARNTNEPLINITHQTGEQQNNITLDTLSQRLFLKRMVFDKIEKSLNKQKIKFLFSGFEIVEATKEVKYFYISPLKEKKYFNI